MSAVRYLSGEWFDSVRDAIATMELDPEEGGEAVSFGYVVSELPQSHPRAGSSIAYTLTLHPAERRASVVEDVSEADVRFTTTYPVAYRVATGQQPAGRAFLDGSIRIGGDIAVLLQRAGDLDELQLRFPELITEDGHA